MAENLVEKILQQRTEYVKLLNKDLTKTDESIKSASDELERLKVTEENVNELSKKVEHAALIPLGKKIYVSGKIVHTGEYFLDKTAFPNSYSVVETLDGTVKQLKRKIERQSRILERGESAREQLRERIKLLEGGGDGEGGGETPKEIISDRGVAIKIGDFYEILELEN